MAFAEVSHHAGDGMAFIDHYDRRRCIAAITDPVSLSTFYTITPGDFYIYVTATMSPNDPITPALDRGHHRRCPTTYAAAMVGVGGEGRNPRTTTVHGPNKLQYCYST